MAKSLSDVESPDVVEEPAGDSRWKSAQIDLSLLKEFEGSGGLFIEEATDEVGVTYGPGHIDYSDDGPLKKKKRKKKAGQADTEKKRRLEEVDHVHVEPIKRKRRRQAEDPSPAAAISPSSTAAPSDSKPTEEDMTKALPEWVQFDLHPAILANLFRLGFKSPTQVQAQCLTPAIRQRKDIVGAAETGSGKTLAFGLPILHHTLGALNANEADAGHGLRAIAILPTRELAVQVRRHFNDAAQGTSVRTECVVGGMSLEKQRRLLKRRPQIVIGTPGRMFALLGLGKEADNEQCEWLRDAVRGLRHLVLDEADRLVESGHFRELDRILGHVYSSLERHQQLQTFVFSATLTLDPRGKWQRAKDGADGGKVAQLAQRLQFREPRAVHIVDLNGPGAHDKKQEGTARNDQGKHGGAAGALLPERLALREAICSDDKDREAVLAMWLLRRYRWESANATGTPGSTCPVPGGRIVLFVNAISSVLRLTPVISLLLESPSAEQVLARVRMTQGKKGREVPGLSVYVLGLHSKMRQKERLKKIERFRASKDAILICTDVAARGLDVPEVAAVLHYQAPRGAEVFVHRSGRTARAGRSGESVAFLGPGDAAQWAKLYRSAGINKEKAQDIGTTAFELTAAREAVRLAVDLELKVHKHAKENSDRSWMRRTADEADLMLSDDDDERENGKKAAPRQALWGLYQQLQARVRRPPKRLGGGPLPRR